MNKQRTKRVFKKLERWNPDYDGDMYGEANGKYVKFTDVADMLKAQFGIDIHDSVPVPSEPKFTVSDCVIEGTVNEHFKTTFSDLFNPANWASALGELGRGINKY